MEKKELLDALTEHGKAIETQTELLRKEYEKGRAESEVKVKELIEDLAKMNEAKNEMQTQLDELDIEIQKVKKEPSKEVKTFAAELREQFTKEAIALKGMTERKVKEIQMEIKSFLETATASVSNGSLIPTPQFEAGISKAPDRMPFLLDLISTGVANSLTIYWVQRKTRTDNEGWVTEGTVTKVGGGSVAQTVLGYETKSASMQNLLAFIKVSNNALDDIDWMMSEIQTELLTLMALKLDADLLTGTVALNGFDGILTGATAFTAAGSTLGAGIAANRYDVLKYAITQVKLAKFKPNYIVMNPSDVLDMELERIGTGGYMLPPYMQSLPGVGGIRVVENTGIAAGTYLVGDFTKAKFWMRKGMDLKIWEQNEDDAINQLKTVTLYMRGTLVVKANDALAFVTDTFADSITEITTV